MKKWKYKNHLWTFVKNSLISLYLLKYKSEKRQEKILFHFIDTIIIINIITIIIVIN